ncbi:MAG: hypothetical protein QOH71_1113 [Blastocatellia bacterium]|jgi:hypothetical protein|nr:hypothetical protein [Blastocatellia bacterium]
MLRAKHVRLLLAIAVLTTLLSALALTYKTSTPALAQSKQEERQLESIMPEHIPLRVKIRKEKEKEFRDLENERWAPDFELEVTNIGNKPIYEFYLMLVFDVKDKTGQIIMAPVYYGRTELGDHRVKATPDDIPLKPGESFFLKIHPGQLGAWDLAAKKGERPKPKKIQVRLDGLSFGDGSGYMGNDGILVPHKRDPSDLTQCAPQQPRSGTKS